MKVRLSSTLTALILTAIFATSASAQTTDPPRENVPTVGVTFGTMKYVNFHSWGVDGKYSTRTMTNGFTPLGFRFGLAGAAAFHNFEGELLKLVQGGVHITADKIGSEKLPLYGNVMFGVGNYFDSTETFMTLAIGADFPLQSQPFKIRVEVAQVWEFGYEVAWRFSGGIAFPLP